MIRVVKLAIAAMILVPFAGILALTLFWLGRPVDPDYDELDDDDAGQDIDEDERTP